MGAPRHILWDLLLNTDWAGGASQIFSPTPTITPGPLKGKGALREKINTIFKWVFKQKCAFWQIKTIDCSKICISKAGIARGQ